VAVLSADLAIPQVFEDTAQVSRTYDALAKEDFRLRNLK